MTEGTIQKSLSKLSGLRWIHADVFTRAPLSGNGLAIFPDAGGLSTETMQRLTQEMRQFESIFLTDELSDGDVKARIFTVEEELDFAGHPVLGAAAALQHLTDSKEARTWRIILNAGEIAVRTHPSSQGYWTEMDQGAATFEQARSQEATEHVLNGLGLEPRSLFNELPVVTVSTGLPYVIVPVTANGLATARIQCTDFEQRLASLGGKFAYLLDPLALEGRTWDNFGLVEDVATGSAAGPVGAYLWRYFNAPEKLVLRQGRFIGRPSEISIRRDPTTDSVLVSGDVVILAEGRFF